MRAMIRSYCRRLELEVQSLSGDYSITSLGLQECMNVILGPLFLKEP